MLAADSDLIAAVVGWVDLTAADVADRLAALAAGSKLAGVRHQVQSEPDPAWLTRELTADLSPAERDAVFAGTATRVYSL